MGAHPCIQYKNPCVILVFRDRLTSELFPFSVNSANFEINLSDSYLGIGPVQRNLCGTIIAPERTGYSRPLAAEVTYFGVL